MSLTRGVGALPRLVLLLNPLCISMGVWNYQDGYKFQLLIDILVYYILVIENKFFLHTHNKQMSHESEELLSVIMN